MIFSFEYLGTITTVKSVGPMINYEKSAQIHVLYVL